MFEKKLFCIFLLAVIPSFSYGSVGLGGDQKELTLSQTTPITKVEYRYELVEAICSRDVVIGTETKCDEGDEYKCEKKPDGDVKCGYVPTNQCITVERVRTEDYACTKSNKVSYNVFDYNVSAKIVFTKSENAKNFNLDECEIAVDLKANTEVLQAYCGSAIVKAKVLERQEKIQGKDKIRTMKVSLDFASIKEISALKKGITSLKYNNGMIEFLTANLEKEKNFRLGLTITRNKFLLKDKVVFSKDLKLNDYFQVDLGYDAFATGINLAQLNGTFDDSKKHTISVTLKTAKKVDLEGAINVPALTNEVRESIVVNQ